MVVCAGCNTQFSLSGRSRHWAQTSQDECLAAAKAYRKQLLAVAAADDSEDGLAQPFGGDYFADYNAKDFTMPNDNQATAISDHDIDMLDEHECDDPHDLNLFSLGASGSGLYELDEDKGDAENGEEGEELADEDGEDDDGEDEDEEDKDFEPGELSEDNEDDNEDDDEGGLDFANWEPPLELEQDTQPSEHAVSRARKDHIIEEAASLLRTSRQTAENNLRCKTFVVRYTQPLPSSGQRTQCPAHSAYKTHINMDGSNLWAPFNRSLIGRSHSGPRCEVQGQRR